MKKIAIVSIIVLLYDLYFASLNTFEDTKSIATLSIVSLGFLFSIFQLRANHDWNRRNIALLEIEKNSPKYFKALRSLTYDRTSLKLEHRKEAYSPDEIHSFICEKDDNGNFKIKPGTSDMYILTEEGIQIRNEIFEILNFFEYISTGVNNAIMDEKVVKDLQYNSMVKIWTLFGDYVKHYRKKHTNGKQTMVQYENLIKKWDRKPWWKTESKTGRNKVED